MLSRDVPQHDRLCCRTAAERSHRPGWAPCFQHSRSFYAVPTMSTENSVVNRKKLLQLQRLLAEILAEILRRGFHGTATVELKVQDGMIQQIVRAVHRIER